MALLASCGQPAANRSAGASDGVTLDIPPATPSQNTVEAPAPPPATPPPPATRPPVTPKPALAKTEAPTAVAKARERAAKPIEPIQQEEQISPPEPSPKRPAAAEKAPAAKLPLPNAVVARTIERIGYACGQVTTTSAVEGAGGPAYKVTCSSGASYRASTVRGHLRFHVWGRK